MLTRRTVLLTLSLAALGCGPKRAAVARGNQATPAATVTLLISGMT